MAAEEKKVPGPTDVRRPVDAELARWRRIYAGDEYFYGDEPGPVARRAVRYHRPYLPTGGRALDAGCGEGQDLAFLVERGYETTGMELTPEGVEKARRLLARRGLPGTVHQSDLRELEAPESFDLVLAVNTLQFLGPDTLPALDRVAAAVAPGGVLGLSMFCREPHERPLLGTVWFVTMEEILERFRDWQPLEAAKLWQWNVATNRPQAFVTLIARKVRPAGTPVVSLG